MIQTRPMAQPLIWREALWPTAPQRMQLLARAIGLVTARMDDLLADRRISTTLDRDAIVQRLKRFDFEAAEDTGDTLEALCHLLDLGLVQSAHARCFGLFNPTPALPGVLADIIAAMWNPQLAVWSHAPAAVEAEIHVLRHVAAKLGLACEMGAAHFTSGGSEANGTALIVALTRLFPTFAAKGVAALARRPLVYASAESHLAWLKLVHQAGLGRDALRLIAVDDKGRMAVEAIQRQVTTDIENGFAPTLIVATAGTTNAGAIDPIEDIANIAERAGAHFHVDAAWAGAVAFSPRLAHLLVGLTRADSVTVDAHKWFSAPMGAGMFFCRSRAWLSASYHVATNYMPPKDAGEDFYVQSQQWSRRFVGLRLFMILAALGREGIASQIDHQTRMGEVLRQQLLDAGWLIVNRTDLPIVCFVDPNGADPDGIVKAVVAAGVAWISVTRTNGIDCIRACITSFLTSAAEVDILVQALADARTATLPATQRA